MKAKLLFGLSAILLLALTSCKKEEQADFKEKDGLLITITAGTKDYTDEHGTRTNISSGEGRWDIGVDEHIGFFMPTANVRNARLSGRTQDQGLSIKFSGNLGLTPANNTYAAYAYYPYGTLPQEASNPLYARVNLPTVQEPLFNSFDPKADLMYAESFNVTIANSAAVDNISTSFNHAVAIVKVVFKGATLAAANGEPIRKFTLTNADAIQLTGHKEMSLVDGTFQNYASADKTPYVTALYEESAGLVLNGTNAIYLCLYPGTLPLGTDLIFEAETENFKIKKSLTITTQNAPAGGIALPANKITLLTVNDPIVTPRESNMDPTEVTIYFKVVSGGWSQGYAVYGHANNNPLGYGNWPGTTLTPISEGWHSFVVPDNRPIHLILNNRGNGRQFDFISNPTKSAAYVINIHATNNNSATWTEVPIPSHFGPALYMIGEEFGDWQWSSPDVVEMTPVHSHSGHFWAVRYITAGKEFKWSPVRAWAGSDFHSLHGSNNGFTIVNNNNARVAADGMYMVWVDMNLGNISIEPAKIYGIGNCFGSWDMGLYPFSVENKKMINTTTHAGELRMYAGRANIAPPYGGNSLDLQWWQTEFIILNGKIVYRGTGPDQTRVPVGAGRKITLDFNAGTGTILQLPAGEQVPDPESGGDFYF